MKLEFIEMGNKNEFISEASAIAEVQSGLGLAIDSLSKKNRIGLKEEVEQRGGVVTLDVVKDIWDAHITDLKKSLPYSMLRDEWQLDYHQINRVDFGTSSQVLN